MFKKELFVIIAIIFLLVFSHFVSSASLTNKNKELITSLFPKYDFYKYLEPGDIIIYLPGLSFQDGHCRLFKEYNETTKRYTLIESFYHVIKYNCRELGIMIPYHLFRYSGIVLVRVNATMEQKQNAIEFAENQVGKFFDFFYEHKDKNHNPNDINDIYSNKFYCSELVWAAYYNCNGTIGEGIDIDCNGWEKDVEDKRGNKYSFVAPLEIINDDDVEVIELLKRN